MFLLLTGLGCDGLGERQKKSPEKPSEKKARERAEAIRRARKLARKRAQREGLIPGKPKPTRTGFGSGPPRTGFGGPR